MNLERMFIGLYENQFGKHINREVAELIVRELPVPDNSGKVSGEHWDFELTTKAGNDAGIDWNRISKNEWYLVMNYMYSLHYNTAEKHARTTYEFFSALALDWFSDIEEDESKTFRHFIHL